MNQTPTNKNIMAWFWVARIDLLTLNPWKKKTSSCKLYTLANVSREKEDDSISNEEDENMLWE
jgi:hypothetical protein